MNLVERKTGGLSAGGGISATVPLPLHPAVVTSFALNAQRRCRCSALTFQHSLLKGRTPSSC